MTASISKLASLLMVVLAVALGTVSCAKKNPAKPDADRDGVADASDRCPDLSGEAQYNGCPWYKVDACSRSAPYTLSGYYWTTNNPVFFFDTSLPQAWRDYCEYSASMWNGVGTRLQIRVNRTTVSAGAAQDQRCVVSRGTLPAGVLGRTRGWYNTTTGALSEADIVLNSGMPMGPGASATTYDVYAILVHEFGHFCGLDHVDDRTQTMYPGIPPDCTIYRTLCAGDELGLRRRYP